MKNKIIIAGSVNILREDKHLLVRILKIIQNIGLMSTEITCNIPFGEYLCNCLNLPLNNNSTDHTHAIIIDNGCYDKLNQMIDYCMKHKINYRVLKH